MCVHSPATSGLVILKAWGGEETRVKTVKNLIDRWSIEVLKQKIVENVIDEEVTDSLGSDLFDHMNSLSQLIDLTQFV